MIEDKEFSIKKGYPDSNFYTESVFLKEEDRPVSRQTEQFERRLMDDWSFVFSFDHTSMAPETVKGEVYLIEVKEGETYYPSVTRVFYSIVPPRKIMVPAMIHDIMYRYQGGQIENDKLTICRLLNNEPPEEYKDYVWQEVEVDREFTELVFHLMMGSCGVSSWKKSLAYYFVCWLGWIYWDNWHVWISNKLNVHG